ncbi:MAG: hypothetical protein QY318_04705 [Candidatus Dojkabacteria bacterium]|nr:MAG: hypothetical protein QY318_04705 [Candidatus Dojkabacteria bacterium]
MSELEKKNILLILDDTSWGSIHNERLKTLAQYGAEIVTASNIPEAIEIISTGNVFHIITRPYNGRWREIAHIAREHQTACTIVTGNQSERYRRAIEQEFPEGVYVACKGEREEIEAMYKDIISQFIEEIKAENEDLTERGSSNKYA